MQKKILELPHKPNNTQISSCKDQPRGILFDYYLLCEKSAITCSLQRFRNKAFLVKSHNPFLCKTKMPDVIPKFLS